MVCQSCVPLSARVGTMAQHAHGQFLDDLSKGVAISHVGQSMKGQPLHGWRWGARRVVGAGLRLRFHTHRHVVVFFLEAVNSLSPRDLSVGSKRQMQRQHEGNKTKPSQPTSELPRVGIETIIDAQATPQSQVRSGTLQGDMAPSLNAIGRFRPPPPTDLAGREVCTEHMSQMPLVDSSPASSNAAHLPLLLVVFSWSTRPSFRLATSCVAWGNLGRAALGLKRSGHAVTTGAGYIYILYIGS